MPEGDTLYAAAERLRPLLRGSSMVGFFARRLTGHRPRPGQRIEDVRAVGKHLLIDFDRDLTLRTHLGMTGSWRLVAPDRAELAQLGPRLRVLITVDRGAAACFAAPTITTFIRGSGESPVDHLGPDLTDAVLDLAEIRARLAIHTDDATPVVDVLLDQRIAAGIGNVYKSEVMHVCRIAPDVRFGTLGPAERDALYAVAHDLLRRNIARPDGRRETAPGGGYFVYGRGRLPCRRCQTRIRRTVNGRERRSTYWCPTCQPDLR